MGEGFSLSPGVLLLLETVVLPQLERWGVTISKIPGWTMSPDLSVWGSGWNAGVPLWVAGMVLAVVTAVLMLLSAPPSGSEKHG